MNADFQEFIRVHMRSSAVFDKVFRYGFAPPYAE